MTVPHLIGDCRFYPDESAVHGPDGQRKLEDRAARVLEVLCDRRGEVVSKDELIASVWQGRQVSANSVAVVIGSLRRALDDDAKDPRLILTVARRGYRLAPAPDAVPPPPPTADHPTGRRIAMLFAMAAVLVLVLAWRLDPPTIDLAVEPVRNDTGRPALDDVARALDPVVLDGAHRLAGVRVHAAGNSAHEGEVRLRSRLILWNGAPELALAATARDGTVLWSGFAAGPPAALARHVADRLAALAPKLRAVRRSDL